MAARRSLASPASAAVAVVCLVGGCTATAQPHSAASISPQTVTTPTPPPIGDSCLVGRWVGSNESTPGNWTWNSEVIAVSGFSGLVITYTADGKETDEFDGTQPLIGNYQGHEIKIVVRGSATFDVHADGTSIVETAAGGTQTVAFYYDGTFQPGGTVAFGAGTSSYTCGATNLHIESPSGRAGYGPQVDDLTRA